MKKYIIHVNNGNGSNRTFDSYSRNAVDHLRNEYGTQNGATCHIYDRHGNAISACAYTDENGGKFIYIVPYININEK